MTTTPTQPIPSEPDGSEVPIGQLSPGPPSPYPFDNSIARLYRYADQQRIPPSLILSFVQDDGSYLWIPLPYYIQQHPELSFEQLLEELVLGDDPSYHGRFDYFVLIYLAETGQRQPATFDQLIKKVDKVLEMEQEYLRIKDRTEFLRLYQLYLNDYQRMLAEAQVKLQTINQVEYNLSQHDPLPVSQFLPEERTRRYRPTWQDGRIPDSYDGLEIFNQIRVTSDVPYVLYVQSFDRRLYKIYDNANLESIQTTNREIKYYDAIYLTIWLGEEESIRESREGYIFAVYRLGINRFIVPGPVILFDRLVDRVRRALPFLDLGEGVDIRSRGRFYLYGVPFSERSFAYSILNNEELSTYLYLEEFLTPFALKRKIKVRYKSLVDLEDSEVNLSSVRSSLDVTINWGISSPEMGLTYEDGSLVPEGIPYIAGLVVRAESMHLIREFIQIFRRLMVIYLQSQPAIETLYDRIINPVQYPEYARITLERGSPYTPFQGHIQTQLGRLKFRAPEIFLEKYARICQPHAQPQIISAREVPEWQARGRQVMPFAGYYFACPQISSPHPGLSQNKVMVNRSRFPFVPCCFKSEQINTGRPTKWRIAYGLADPVHLERYDPSKPLKTRKIAKFGQRGILPPGISDLFRNNLGQLYRIGVDESPSSLLEAAMLAAQDPGIHPAWPKQQRLAAVTERRRQLRGLIYPSLVKQEAYDLSDEEILNRLTDPRIFLDPRLFFRVIEELYQVNLFIFVPLKYKAVGSRSEIWSGELEVPRYLLFPARFIDPNRRSLFIYMHWGSESDGLKVPQCELIGQAGSQAAPPSFLFSTQITEFMTKVYQLAYPQANWTREGLASTQICLNPGLILSNVLSAIRAGIIEGLEQALDETGKLRAIKFRFGNQVTTILTPPSPPQNLPQMRELSRVDLASLNAWFEVESYSLETSPPLVDVEPPVTAGTSGIDPTITSPQQIIGAWGRIRESRPTCTGDRQELLYIPVSPQVYQPGQWNLPLPDPGRTLNRPNPEPELLLAPELTMTVTRPLEWRIRTFQIFMTLLRWLLGLEPDVDLMIIVNQYFQIGQASLIYDFSKLESRLPLPRTIEDGLEWLETQQTGLVQDGKITLPSQELLIKVIAHFELHRFSQPLPRILPLYQTLADFTPQPGVRIFLSTLDLLEWAQTNRHRGTTVLRHALDPGRVTEMPYVLAVPKGNYLLQYVQGDRYKRALWVSYIWREQHLNMGYLAQHPAVLPILHPEIVVADSRGDLRTIEAGRPEERLTLLRTGEQTYAALLPLDRGPARATLEIDPSGGPLDGIPNEEVNQPPVYDLDWEYATPGTPPDALSEEDTDQAIASPRETFGGTFSAWESPRTPEEEDEDEYFE